MHYNIINDITLILWSTICIQMRDGLDVDSPEDVPTEEMIERMEERMEAAQSEQKNLFLIIFQVSPPSSKYSPRTVVKWLACPPLMQ